MPLHRPLRHWLEREQLRPVRGHHYVIPGFLNTNISLLPEITNGLGAGQVQVFPIDGHIGFIVTSIEKSNGDGQPIGQAKKTKTERGKQWRNIS